MFCQDQSVTASKFASDFMSRACQTTTEQTQCSHSPSLALKKFYKYGTGHMYGYIGAKKSSKTFNEQIIKLT
jgi:hypothetical protein